MRYKGIIYVACSFLLTMKLQSFFYLGFTIWLINRHVGYCRLHLGMRISKDKSNWAGKYMVKIR